MLQPVIDAAEGRNMTISSSLNAGVSGLNVIASRLATISDNIANSATYGYKRETADFQSMVLNGVGGSYSAGGVRVSTHREIDRPGPLITTDNPTDLAVSGRGMIPVTTVAAIGGSSGPLPTLLVTTGSFRPDANGILRTDGGLALLGWPANPDGTIPSFPNDTFDGLKPVHIGQNQFAGDPTTKVSLGVNLPATETRAGSPGTPQDLSVEYFDNLGTSETLKITFNPIIPATGESNQWNMVVEDSASGGAVIGEYNITFDSSRTNGGSISSVNVISGGPYDPVTGEIQLQVAGGNMTLGIGAPGSRDGLTQLSGSFAPVSVVKDGSPVGNLTSVEIDANGNMSAIYDVGFTRRIYQIPLVDVPNPNGLITHNNQTYQISPQSGPFFLWKAGDGPVGELVGFAREESTTDIAGELTQLIQTQRAYSSNAKIIQTVDQMLQETTNIKR